MTRQFSMVGVLLAACWLRVWRLDLRALWWDEGLSLYFSRFGYLGNALATVELADTNPPVYRLLLSAWTATLGSSAFTTRLLSVLAGLLLLAVVVRLARDLRLTHSGVLFVAGAVTASPMLVYYAQEAKGYSMVALAAVAAVLLWWRLHGWLRHTNTSPPHWPQFVFFGAALLVAIGSHYIAAFLIVTLNIGTALLLWRAHPWRLHHWRFVAALVAAQAGAALALLPYVLLTYAGTSAAVRGETGVFIGLGTPLDFLRIHALSFASGPRAAWWPGGLAVLVMLGLAAAALLRARNAKHSTWWLAAWALLPLAMGLALHSYHPFFFPRFLLYTVPAWWLLAAVAVQRRGWLAAGAALVLVAAWTPTLAGFYTRWDSPDEDWRPVAEHIAPLVRPGDAAIYVWGWIPGYLHAYLPPAPEPDYRLGFFTPDNLDPRMVALAADHDRIWLLDYQVAVFDARNMAAGWLTTRYALVHDRWIHPPGSGAHVALFVRPRIVDGNTFARFANGIQLGYTPQDTTVAAGDALAVTLRWQAVNAAPTLSAFLHLLDGDGRLIAGRDGTPVNGLRSFASLESGDVLDDPRGLLVPPGTPPGQYHLATGVYDLSTGERVLLENGEDAVLLGLITVE